MEEHADGVSREQIHLSEELVDQLARDLFNEILGVFAVVTGGVPLDVQQHAERQCVFGFRRIVERIVNGGSQEEV